MSYPAFTKIPRWHREVVLTEKIDGTNGLVSVMAPGETWPEGQMPPEVVMLLPDGTQVAAGSRKRWLTPDSDNFGFAQWVWNHADELAKLGLGNHYGEWYGKGINRNYGLDDRRFMLFNVAKWEVDIVRPKVCEVATVLSRCQADELGDVLSVWIDMLQAHGSAHVPGFPRPEGIVLYHTAGNHLYKVTLEGDRAKSADGFVIRPLAGEAIPGILGSSTDPDFAVTGSAAFGGLTARLNDKFQTEVAA